MCGELVTFAGPPELYEPVPGVVAFSITDVPWSTNFTYNKLRGNRTVLRACMTAAAFEHFLDGEQVRCCGDRPTLSGKRTGEDGKLKYGVYSCACGAAKPPNAKEQAAAAARSVKREAAAPAAAAPARPAEPQETAAAVPPRTQEGGATATVDAVGEGRGGGDCSGDVAQEGLAEVAQQPPLPIAATTAQPEMGKKNGERGGGAARSKKVGCPVRLTVNLTDETHDDEPVYLVTYLEWEHADACKVLAPRMVSDSCKKRLEGWFLGQPGLAAWEAVQRNCTFVADEYARHHPKVTSTVELQAHWQQVRYILGGRMQAPLPATERRGVRDIDAATLRTDGGALRCLTRAIEPVAGAG